MLNNEHLEMLCEMTEVHFQCFEKFYKEYGISYASVLELNHKKMLDISDNCIDCDPDILCFIFESIIKDYKMMLNRENPYLDSDS
jgi:hypothetical protein